jgi:hypothetical protein
VENGKWKVGERTSIFHFPLSIFSFLSMCLCVSVVISSCTSKSTDLRTLVPAESLVYLETNDLGAALQPIVDSKPFTEAAKIKPDLSALKGVQVAVAITGFETSEEKLTDEHSVGKIQPHFVAIADTHAWNFQAVGFAEKKLGSFVANLYDSEPKLEQIDKNGGKHFTWTAEDGRKAYALVIDSLIYFTNDETSIEKCLAVRRGEADNIAKTGKIQPSQPGTLASGYISADGVAQIANIAALKFASDASDESEIQSAIAGILPKLIRSTITDATWAQTKTDTGLQDTWQINMPADVAHVFNETMAPDESSAVAPSLLPSSPTSITEYNLKDPRAAWRSIVLVASKQIDGLGTHILSGFSDLLFEPYGIRDADSFLSGVKAPVVTTKYGQEGENDLVIAAIGDKSKIESSITIDFKQKPKVAEDGETFVSGGLMAFYPRQLGFIVIGDAEAHLADKGAAELDRLFKAAATDKASIAAITRDGQGVQTLVDMFGSSVSSGNNRSSTSFTETRFNRSGMERKTTSDFGFIGWIIAQLNDD